MDTPYENIFYMCLVYNSATHLQVKLPIFFNCYYLAYKFAIKEVKVINNFTTIFIPYTCILNVKIFKIPFNKHIHLICDQIYNQHIQTIYDPLTNAVLYIQKRWRIIYNRRLRAAIIIKKNLRKAIANPYTKLCQKRLLHEFNNMLNI
jgi:hypothetical protein